MKLRKVRRFSSWTIPSNAQRRKLRRSEEHTSELQSPCNLVCRLLLEKKKPHRSTRRRHTCRSPSVPRTTYIVSGSTTHPRGARCHGSHPLPWIALLNTRCFQWLHNST